MLDRYDDGPGGQARSRGLRSLSRLTWRATQLGAIATVGFAVLFARTAPAATGGHTAPKAPATPSASPSPSLSPSPTPSARPHRHHRHHKPAAAPGTAAPAPSQSLAPPTTPPAPPPSPAPSPVQTTSSPSTGGG